MNRSIFEALLREKRSTLFRDDWTDIPYYDNILRKPDYFQKNKGVIFSIEWMNPKEYLEKCADGFDTTMYNLVYGKRRDEEKIEHIKDFLSKGKKLSMPIIEYWKDGKMRTQEGIHRAIVALEQDERYIPVMVVKQLWR